VTILNNVAQLAETLKLNGYSTAASASITRPAAWSPLIYDGMIQVETPNTLLFNALRHAESIIMWLSTYTEAAINACN